MVDTFVHVKYACLHLEKNSSSFLSTDWKIVVNPIPFVWCFSHSQMEHYFFSYLLTWEVDLIEILEIMAQTWPNVIFLSLQPTKVTSDFILN